MRILSVLICLCACAQFPALEGTIDPAAREAPYPRLSPLPRLAPDADSDEAGMQARIAALQARAAQLRETDIAALQ